MVQWNAAAVKAFLGVPNVRERGAARIDSIFNSWNLIRWKCVRIFYVQVM